jgi:hypothetical protein
MTAEFDWWLLILGLVIGAGLVWLILAELPRRDVDLGPEEHDLEASWIAAQLRPADRRWDADAVAAVLREHRAYLRLPPPEEATEAGAPPAARTDSYLADGAPLEAPPAPGSSSAAAASAGTGEAASTGPA